MIGAVFHLVIVVNEVPLDIFEIELDKIWSDKKLEFQLLTYLFAQKCTRFKNWKIQFDYDLLIQNRRLIQGPARRLGCRFL